MYKISVILPVYNAENTIHRTINSIINQTIGFENIELIMVDDKSTDNSKNIIKDYSNKYENIKPIFLDENTGSPAIPRNIGIKNSTAPYLMFLDSDDKFFRDYCEVMYNAIINNDTDIVHSNHSNKLNKHIYIPKSIDKINFDEKNIDSGEKLYLKLTAWSYIFNSSLIKENKIEFPLTLHEDGVFCLHCLLKTKKSIIHLHNYPGYIYLVENEASVTHNVDLNDFKCFLKGYKLCGDLLKENDSQYVEQNLFNTFINMAIFILFKLDQLDKGIEILYDFEKTLDFDIFLNSKPLNYINQKIMKKKFFQAKLIIKSLSILYNNKKIRNLVFIRYTNLKLLNL